MIVKNKVSKLPSVWVMFATLLGITILLFAAQRPSSLAREHFPESEPLSASHDLGGFSLPFRFEEHENSTFISRNQTHSVLLKRDRIEIGLAPVEGQGSKVADQRKFEIRDSRFEIDLQSGIRNTESDSEAKTRPQIPDPIPGGETAPSQASNIFMTFIDSSPAATLSGVDQRSFRTNYLLGNDPKNWQTQIASYSQVKYVGLYPGIDLVFYLSLIHI